MLGGHNGIGAIVNRFYDLMDSDPAYRDLRAMHAEDLAPMRRSLCGFLAAWAGGPRDWFVENPGKCMMSVHGRMAISPAAADQWVAAMTRAVGSSGIEPTIAGKLVAALSAMASSMVRSDQARSVGSGREPE